MRSTSRPTSPLEVTAADTGGERVETLTVTLDGTPVEPQELIGAVGTRLHSVRAHPGRLLIDYHAQAVGRSEPVAVTALKRLKYLRPSRYAQFDRIEAVARAKFAGIIGGANLLSAVSSWVGRASTTYPAAAGPPTVPSTPC